LPDAPAARSMCLHKLRRRHLPRPLAAPGALAGDVKLERHWTGQRTRTPSASGSTASLMPPLLRYGRAAAFMAGRSERGTWRVQLAETRAEVEPAVFVGRAAGKESHAGGEALRSPRNGELLSVAVARSARVHGPTELNGDRRWLGPQSRRRMNRRKRALERPHAGLSPGCSKPQTGLHPNSPRRRRASASARVSHAPEASMTDSSSIISGSLITS
jgi:hypothetical protein